MDPFLGLERLTLLGVNRDGTVHLLHLFFSVPVGPYYMDRRLLDFIGEFTSEGLPPATDPLVGVLAVRRVICAVPHADHHVHVEGVTLPIWKLMSCEREENIQEDAQDMDLQGLNFFPPGGALCLLGQGANISEASCLPSSLLSSRTPPYNEAPDWL